MKRFISLAFAIVFACVSFASCGKIPAFVPIDEENVVGVHFIAGSQRNIDTEEYRALIAEAYNKSGEPQRYKDKEADWAFVVICGNESEDKSPIMYSVSHIEDAKFNVRVSGSEGDGSQIDYLVENEELRKLGEEELLPYKDVEISVNVKIACGAGTVDKEGAERESEEIVFEGEQTIRGNESNRITVNDALMQTVIAGGYGFTTNKETIASVGGYEETEVGENGEMLLQRWRFYLNGEAVEKGDVASTSIAEGDTVEMIFERIVFENN